MTEKTTSEILAAAADQLEEHGWFQGGPYEGTFGDLPNIPVCLWTALHIVVNGCETTSDWSENDPIVSRCLDVVEDIVGMPPVAWNEGRERTGQEVIAVLREAAVVAA